MATKLEQKQAEKTEKVNRMAKFFEEKKTPEGFNMTKAETEQVQSWNKELEELSVEVKSLHDMDEIERKNLERIKELNTLERPGGVSFKGGIDPRGMGNDGAALMGHRPRLGDIFTKSKGYKERKGNTFSASDTGVEMKTLFSTTNGWDPFVTRLPRVALSPQQAPKIVDAFPVGTTNQHSIKFMLETTYTNAAAEAVEGALYAESALKLTEQIQAVVKLATFLPVTDEQLEDEEQARDYLNNRLELMLRQRLDSQLANGDGSGANLLGLANISGINTLTLGTSPSLPTDSAMDLILRSIVKVQTVGFADPSAILMNPTDWMNIQLLRTADGLYIWGHPSSDGPKTMWGVPVVASTYITAGTGYVADFIAHTMLFWRRGIEFLVSNSHSDYFARGQQAIRADARCSLVCFRPTAITKFSGI